MCYHVAKSPLYSDTLGRSTAKPLHVRFQCICCPYLTVPFDLYLYPAYRNAQGSVEEDPVALLQASHTAAKPSKVWCALSLAHMQLPRPTPPSSPPLPQSAVLCCAVLWILSPRLITLQRSAVTSPTEEMRMIMSSLWLLPFTPFCLVFVALLFCHHYPWHPTSPVYLVCVHSPVVIPGVSSRIRAGVLLHKCIYLFIFYISLVWNLPHVTVINKTLGAHWECETFHVHFLFLCMITDPISCSPGAHRHVANVTLETPQCCHNDVQRSHFSPRSLCQAGENGGADRSRAGLVWIREGLARPQGWILFG